MPSQGWKQLLRGACDFRGDDSYPIAAYSEFMPPPRLVRKPYGCEDLILRNDDDACGWPVVEYEEALTLRPGLDKIACQVVNALMHLSCGQSTHGISKNKLIGNYCWPDHLAKRAAELKHEHYVTMLPLALSRTQDDKGRVLWTLFGGSEQGPARPFWKSFYTAPNKELPQEQAKEFFRRLLRVVYHDSSADLEQAGLRILPCPEGNEGSSAIPWWSDGPVPKWTRELLWTKGQSLRSTKYLLTFQPFSRLPAAVQQGYLAGDLHLLPCPGSLLFWASPPYIGLHKELPLAVQIPLLHTVARHEGPAGIRVPQSGWLHEAHAGQPDPDERRGPIYNSFRRTHRWGRVYRDENELDAGGHADKLVHVLFSTSPNDMGLYDKPMARNVQLWTHDYRSLLHGPHAAQDDIQRAIDAVREGGMFGYRFYFPPMRVGKYEVFWHRPLVAYKCFKTGEPARFPEAPTGYLTAYPADRPDSSKPIELWPRLLQREPHLAALELFAHSQDPRPRQTTVNIRKLLDTRQLLDGLPLPRTLARQLLTLPKKVSLDEWLDALPERASDPGRARRLVHELREGLESHPSAAKAGKEERTRALTFEDTARRSFEETYWKTIAYLAEGRYRNKNNADCARDPATQAALSHHHSDLEALGNHLASYYTETISKARMKGKAFVGDLPFAWKTDFDYPLYGGWIHNQEGKTLERDVIVVIPGRDRTRALIMADHYDTAYMADHYEKQSGGNGARLAAAGADDNHSATAALMLGAPIFLELSRARKLACDIWLIHLTGEEFPADCMGARHLCQCLVEGTLRMRLHGGEMRDLSQTRVQGVYVLDMIAHNNDHERDVFQMAPGASRESMWLAYQAHLANEAWNASTHAWNRRPQRRGRGRSERMPDGSKVPAVAQYPELYGEIRPYYDPRSTLYNTDGQIFSDAGVPVVLFMENYDINRTGYHDSQDTMANIDLDYGAAVAAIAIEAVARAATEQPRFSSK
ncbi:MAG TPA: M28 family peptidase [Gemmataceae bacterium]|nr:M28 family peptidase [Gemmataceae bacterium]